MSAELIEAASYGDAVHVRELITAGVDVHAYEDAALRAAAGLGYPEVVSALLSACADVHAREDEALRCATRRGHFEIVRELVAHGVELPKYAMDVVLRG
jgi:hypothetical protein